MRSRVYETVERPSVCPLVCLSYHSTAAAVCGGGFTAERRARGRYRSTAVPAAQQQMRAASRLQLTSEAAEERRVESGLCGAL